MVAAGWGHGAPKAPGLELEADVAVGCQLEGGWDRSDFVCVVPLCLCVCVGGGGSCPDLTAVTFD
jgi:hypothetical protein